MNLGLDEQFVPVCEPYLSVEDVLKWSPPAFCCNGSKSYAEWKRPGLETEGQGRRKINRPQFLVCHDMCGGYLDDRFTQGCDNADAYRFYSWSGIDTFIYFSHNFVTIPPFGWVCASHQHGVDILGTIITEWEDGSNICKKLLQSKEYIDVFISKLGEIMLFYGFDGWLINIENEIQVENIPLLQYFVQQLTIKCHSYLSHAKVLWYDSVIRSGSLIWQDELNEENEMFFDVSDGIFLNYGLTDEKLERSLRRAKKSNRQFDVYAGVDVFGRATPGGGGFNCKQIIQTILQNGLSCAIFAQGWVYECCGVEDFDANEQKFWSLLSDYLPVKSVSLPISTSFCRGYGKKYCFEGKCISEKGWHNLSLQQLQPSYAWEFDEKESFIGGGCLKLPLIKSGNPIIKKLFRIRLANNEQIDLSAVWRIYEREEDLYQLGFVLSLDFKESPSALILLDDCNVNKNMVTHSLKSAFHENKIETEKVIYLPGNGNPNVKKHHWMESSFNFNTSHLLTNVRESVDVDLALILVPKQKTGMDVGTEQVSLLIGHLKMHQQKTESDLTPKELVKNSSALVEGPSPLSRVDMDAAIDSHSSLSSPHDVPYPGNSQSWTDSSHSQQFHLAMNHMKLPDIEKVPGIAKFHGTSFFLHWRVSNNERVNFYLISIQNCIGAEQFVGSSVSNCYIFDQKQYSILCNTNTDSDTSHVKFVIQPVLKGEYLLGKKFFIEVNQ